MKVQEIAPPKIVGDPYEEDCTGAHNGRCIEIQCSAGLTIKIQEVKSGIGDYYVISGHTKEQQTTEVSIYIDDDGELKLGVLK